MENLEFIPQHTSWKDLIDLIRYLVESKIPKIQVMKTPKAKEVKCANPPLQHGLDAKGPSREKKGFKIRTVAGSSSKEYRPVTFSSEEEEEDWKSELAKNLRKAKENGASQKEIQELSLQINLTTIARDRRTGSKNLADYRAFLKSLPSDMDREEAKKLYKAIVKDMENEILKTEINLKKSKIKIYKDALSEGMQDHKLSTMAS